MPNKLIIPEGEGRKKLAEAVTVPWEVFVSKDTQKRENIYKDLFRKPNTRKDGRLFHEHRKIHMKCGVVKDARGSAYVEMGGTKVIASVNGPVEMPQGIEFEDQGYLNCEVKFSQFSCKSQEEEEELGTEVDSVTDSLNRAIEPAITKEELSNVQVNLVVVIVENDGSLVSAAVIAASLAFTSARLPMLDLVSSASLCIVPSEDDRPSITLIDPTEEEMAFSLSSKSKESRGTAVLSYMVSSEQVSDCVLSGRLDLKTVTDSLPVLKEHCTKIYHQMQRAIIKDVKMVKHIILERNRPADKTETTDDIQESLKNLST